MHAYACQRLDETGGTSGGWHVRSRALPDTGFEEAFLIARRLFQIPPGIGFPPPSDEATSTYPNPDKPDYLWEDQLEVERGDGGVLLVIRYYVRGEGGGATFEIAPHEEGMRIGSVAIAD